MLQGEVFDNCVTVSPCNIWYQSYILTIHTPCKRAASRSTWLPHLLHFAAAAAAAAVGIFTSWVTITTMRCCISSTELVAHLRLLFEASKLSVHTCPDLFELMQVLVVKVVAAERTVGSQQHYLHAAAAKELKVTVDSLTAAASFLLVAE
jgi:hypothetical protein